MKKQYWKSKSTSFNRSWNEDNLDILSNAKVKSIVELASRKSLARNNIHEWDFKNLLHKKTTTIRSGFISSIASQNILCKYSNIRTAKIISFDSEELSFIEELIPSYSAFDIYMIIQKLLVSDPDNQILISNQNSITDKLFLDTLKIKEFKKEIVDEVGYLFESIYDELDYVLPTIPYKILMEEAVKQIKIKLNIGDNLDLSLEINKLNIFLTESANSIFRDANPLNTRIPFSDGLGIDIGNLYSKSNLSILEFELRSVPLIGSLNLILNKAVQVDLEMLGMKKTTSYDDFVHMIGLLPTDMQYTYALEKYSSMIDNKDLICYHLTSIFRLTRSAARRLCYHLDSPEDINRYYPFEIQDNFGKLYERLIYSINFVESGSNWNFTNLKEFISLAIVKLKNIK